MLLACVMIALLLDMIGVRSIMLLDCELLLGLNSVQKYGRSNTISGLQNTMIMISIVDTDYVCFKAT